MQTPEGADRLTAGDWTHSQEAALGKTIIGSAAESSFASAFTTSSAGGNCCAYEGLYGLGLERKDRLAS